MKKKILSLILAMAMISVLMPLLPVSAYDMGKTGVYQTIAVGYDHTAAIKTDGSLWTWGHNGFGQLGNGSNDDNKHTPVKIMDSVKLPGDGVFLPQPIPTVIPDESALIFTNIENTGVTITATNCNNITDGTVILAVYNADGKIKEVITKDFAQTSMFDNLDLTDCTVKAMLWDNVNGMKPLALSAE